MRKTIERPKTDKVLKEKQFDNNTAKVQLPEYNALRDSNLRQYFESPNTIKYLHRIGFVDHSGHIVDLDKNKAKVAIIEQEFKYAEKAESLRLREEEAARRMVQMRRHHALKEAQKHEKVRRLKEENRIRQELIRANKTNKAMIELEASLRKERTSSRRSAKTAMTMMSGLGLGATSASGALSGDEHGGAPEDDFEEFEDEEELIGPSEPAFDRPTSDGSQTRKELAKNVPSGVTLMRDAERGTFEDEGEEIADINKTQDFDSQQRFNREQASLRNDSGRGDTVFLTQAED